MKSITDNGGDYLGEADPEHVIQLGQLHDAIGVRLQRTRDEGSVALEVPDEPLNLLSAHTGVDDVQDHEQNRGDKGDHNSDEAHVGLEDVDDLQDFAPEDLEARHVA